MTQITEPFKRYKSKGLCIYCGRSDVKLEDEHIIPFAIAGNGVVFESASCRRCADKFNKEFEQYVLRKTFGPFRFKYGAPTRNERPTTMELKFLAMSSLDEAPIIVHIDNHEPKTYPLDLICLRLKSPKILTGEIAGEHDTVDAWSNIRNADIASSASRSPVKRVFLGEYIRFDTRSF